MTVGESQGGESTPGCVYYPTPDNTTERALDDISVSFARTTVQPRRFAGDNLWESHGAVFHG